METCDGERIHEAAVNQLTADGSPSAQLKIGDHNLAWQVGARTVSHGMRD